MNRTKKPASNHPWRADFGTTKQRQAAEARTGTIIPHHAKPVK